MGGSTSNQESFGLMHHHCELIVHVICKKKVASNKRKNLSLCLWVGLNLPLCGFIYNLNIWTYAGEFFRKEEKTMYIGTSAFLFFFFFLFYLRTNESIWISSETISLI